MSINFDIPAYIDTVIDALYSYIYIQYHYLRTYCVLLSFCQLTSRTRSVLTFMCKTVKGASIRYYYTYTCYDHGRIINV